MTDDWLLVEEGFDPAAGRAYEGLFTLGSGYMHIRGSLEEGLAGAPQNTEYSRSLSNVTAERFVETPARWGTFVPGVFGPRPPVRREMINLPWMLHLAPHVGDEKLDVLAGNVEAHRRELDMKTATLRRSLRWRTRAGAMIDVRTQWFVSAARPALLVQRMVLSAGGSAEVAVRAGVDADVRTAGFDHFTDIKFEAVGAAGLRCSVRTNGGDDVEILSRVSAENAEWQYEASDRAAALAATLQITAGTEIIIEKRSALTTSRDLERQSCDDVLVAAEKLSFRQLHDEHAAVWAGRWDAADVVIEGDDASQRAMRASIFHLLRSHVPGDPRVAVCAKGYAGDAYYGHYFWDTDIYLLPFHLYTDPARAGTLVDFRIGSLDSARQIAAGYGYPGAKYAWQSDDAGRECAFEWQYADYEVHVTAAVAYGLLHYARATGDEAFLEGPPAEVLVETARYWLARLARDEGEDRYHLLGVMGPDEYTIFSHDNSYTNRMVALTLSAAAACGRAGGATDEQCAAFADAAGKLPVTRRDDGLVLQCDRFDQLGEPDFEHTWGDRSQPFARFVSPEYLYRVKALKQADVLMLMMLFPDEFTDEEIRQAWDYYVPYTTHDSSLSRCTHAVVAARCGMEAEAWRMWRAGCSIDLGAVAGGAAEGIHIASAGGNWMAVVYGFAGMASAMNADVLTLDPHLPKQWTRLAFPLLWKGSAVGVEITHEAVTVTNRSAAAMDVVVSNQWRGVKAGAAEVFTKP